MTREGPGPPHRHAAAAAAGAVVLIWGANFAIQKVIYPVIQPEGFMFARAVGLSVLALALMWWLNGRRWHGAWPRLAPGEWRSLLRVALVGQVVQIALSTYGIHWSTAFSAALLLACGPVFTLILLWFLRGEALGARRLVGVGVALAGMLLFSSEKLATAAWRASLGDAMLMLSVWSFALYTIVLTPAVARHGGVRVMCLTNLLAAPLMIPGIALAAALQHGRAFAVIEPFERAAPAVWAGLIWALVMGAFLSWILWGWINAELGVARCAPLVYLVPPVAGMIAWATVGETFGPLKVAGAALALAGVAWTQFGGAWSRRRETVPGP